MSDVTVDLVCFRDDLAEVKNGEAQDGLAPLVAAARNGDRGAFARLHDHYAPMVHGILLSRVPRSEIDDLMQDVFLQALRRLPGLRDTAAFGGWLAAITRNRAHDYHRRSRDTEELTDDLGSDTRDHTEGQRVLNLIRSLPEAYRETLILRFVEGLTGPEIAERTGLTPGSVRVNLHRGVSMLRERLGVVL